MAADITVSPAPTVALLLSSRGEQNVVEEGKGSSSNHTPAAGQEAQSPPADTVSLSPLVQQAFEEARQKDEKQQENDLLNSKKPSNRSAAKVEFVYDVKGELITKYLDSSDRLVYQLPSELMLHMKEGETKSKTAVNTKA